MDIRFFDEKTEKFITSLEKPTIAKVLRTIDLLQQFGNKLGMPHSRSMKGGLFELRARGVQEVRIIYAFHGDTAILLHAFLKKSNAISKKDLQIAYDKRKLLD